MTKCKEGLSFEECELAILRQAVDEIEQETGESKIKSPTKKEPKQPILESMREPFVIDKKMATLTLVGILVKQKYYNEALSVLDILDKKGESKKKITQKRNSIKKLMSK